MERALSQSFRSWPRCDISDGMPGTKRSDTISTKLCIVTMISDCCSSSTGSEVWAEGRKLGGIATRSLRKAVRTSFWRSVKAQGLGEPIAC